MATAQLPPDFKEFLRLLNAHRVDYLLIGGYAVGYHGYPRATADMDVWIAIDAINADKMVEVLKEFGFDSPDLSGALFLAAEKVVRMGEPPLRIDVLTSILGVEFRECYQARVTDEIEGVKVNLIGLDHLKASKRAAGRHQDLSDLEHLP